MPIVTLSREYGSGGLRIGRRVAELLEVDFVDAILVEEVARRLQITEEAVRRWDERREGVVLRLLRAIRAAHPEYAAGNLMPEAAETAGDPEIVGRVTRASSPTEAIVTDPPFLANLALWTASVVAILYSAGGHAG